MGFSGIPERKRRSSSSSCEKVVKASAYEIGWDNLMSWKVAPWKDGHSKHLVGDKTPHSHHGGAAVVQFDGTLLKFFLLGELVPTVVEGSVAVVTDEFGLVVDP